jgi:hypothetical protein
MLYLTSNPDDIKKLSDFKLHWHKYFGSLKMWKDKWRVIISRIVANFIKICAMNAKFILTLHALSIELEWLELVLPLPHLPTVEIRLVSKLSLRHSSELSIFEVITLRCVLFRNFEFKILLYCEVDILLNIRTHDPSYPWNILINK